MVRVLHEGGTVRIDSDDNRGGVARLAFEKKTPREQSELRQAIQSAPVERIKSWLQNPFAESPDLPHSHLHYVVDSNFALIKVDWASGYIAREVGRVLLRARPDVAFELITAAAAIHYETARRPLFAALVHAMLSRGGELRLVSLECNAAHTVQCGPLSHQLFYEPAELTRRGVYAQPTTRNFPALDAIIVPAEATQPLLLLHITVTQHRHVRGHALAAALNDLPTAVLATRKLMLVSVVPEDVALGFPLQSYLNADLGGGETLLADVEQFKLVVDQLAVQEAVSAARAPKPENMDGPLE